MMNGESAQSGFDVLPQAMLLLVVAIVVAPLFHRLRFSPVLGYLVAGAILGNAGFGVLAHTPTTQLLGDLGVVFLLFIIGLELSLERLRLMRRWVFGFGGLQVLLCGSLFTAIGWQLGLGGAQAVVVGFALALSSTAMVVQLLTERRELSSQYGRAAFAVLLFQDLAVIPLLLLVSLLDTGSAPPPEVLGESFLRAVAVVAAVLAVGVLAMPRLFGLVAGSRRSEAFTAMALLAVLGTAWATEYAGMSMALGAFLAGVLLAGSEYRHQISADIKPFEGLLLGLFFVTVGARLEFAPVLAAPVAFLLLLGGLLAAKTVVIGLLGRLFGLSSAHSVRAGMMLAQGGEFAFVLIGLAAGRGLVGAENAQIVLALVGVSMALTPLLEMASRRIAAHLERRSEHGELPRLASEAADLADHIIVAGFGRVGQTVGLLLDSRQIPWLALDMDPDVVAAGRRANLSLYFGDASRRDVLAAAGLERARAVVVTIDDSVGAAAAVATVHSMMPALPIFARARDYAHSQALMQAGAHEAVPETLEASLQLAGRVLRTLDVPDPIVARLIDLYRGQNYAALRRVAQEEAAMAELVGDGRPGKTSNDPAG